MRRGTVEHYLHELDEELRDLPADRRRELLEEIREHIGESLAERPNDEAGVLNVLDRVGEPAVIAEEARRRFGIRRATAGLREILVLVLIPIGGVIVPLVGWVVGAILLATSQVWTSREKVIGLLLVPGGLLPAFLFGLMPGQTCNSAVVDGEAIAETCSGGVPVWLGRVILVALIALPIWTTFFLATRMNRRAAPPGSDGPIA